MQKKVVPYHNSKKDKKEQVAEMFDNISNRYDFLNSLLSLGTHKYWQQRLTHSISPIEGKHILDVATGTGAIAFALSAKGAKQIIGIDISQQMLNVGLKKLKSSGIKNVILLPGDAENIQFENNSFDAVTVAYGVRNFSNLETGLREILRVLKPGAQLAVLEFSKPKIFPIKQLFRFYSRYAIPFIGRLVAKDQRAYSYLPESVQQFPEGESFLRILRQEGFINATCKPLTFGIASLYVAYKP